MQSIRINKKMFNAPSSWSELTEAQLLNITRIRKLHPDQDEAQKQLAPVLFAVPAAFVFKQHQLIQLTECLDWMLLENNLSTWLIKSIFINRKRRFSGPKNNLANLTGSEFIYTEYSYQKWLFDTDLAHLHQLTAVLFRNRTESFDPDKIEAKKNLFSKLPDWFHEAIALNYAGCRNTMISMHPHIWKKAMPAEGTETPAQELRLTSWTDIFLELAESGKFGDYNSTIQYNVWLLLKDLDKNAKKIEDLEAKK